ncbi:MAG: tetratricopeptide repeat protein [Gammaproteobacteria bacterium]|nr:tetratricopeptide repeat protein [Gammaproteobacteria bacterium]
MVSLLWCAPAIADDDNLHEKPHTVRDLYYGVVLYEFYQQNYYSAAVNLLTAQQQNRLQHHDVDGQLLLGGLYLSYGLHSEAEAIFTKLIDDSVSPQVRDRAWFYLGKIRYQKQLFPEAALALSRVGDNLDDALREEFRILTSNLLMAQEKYADAADFLAEMVNDNSQSNYARFNLGVALIRSGRSKEGKALLQQVGVLQSTASDLKALRDKANLVLGYSLIKNDPNEAKKYLRAVRLQGPFSNRALLGLGWAEVEHQRYEAALVPWRELAGRERNDVAVFESLLSVGSALERLRAYPQAMQSYRDAVAAYEQELSALNETVEAVREGRLWSDLLSQVQRDEIGWFWEAELLPKTSEARYLTELMASHRFHEAIKNLRDLNFLTGKLNRWEQEMPALENMLTLRTETYEAQISRLTPEQTLDHVVDVRTSRDIFIKELRQIAERNDSRALATETEIQQLERLQKIEKRIWRVNSHPKANQRKLTRYRDRYRFFSGLISYEIDTTFAIRKRKIQNSLNSLDRELEAALAQQNSLQRARILAPQRFQGFNARIKTLNTHVSELQISVKQAFDEQKKQLQVMVDIELDRLRKRLVDYIDQARFSLAHLQDMAASRPVTTEKQE